MTSSGKVELDEEDSSVTRPEELLKEIFHRAGLEIIRELQQKKMPTKLYPVKMFALKKV
jgi:protein N-terminal methyltransferase